MELCDAVGVKTSRWVANEILHADDLNFLSQAQYQINTDLFALLAEQRIATGSTKDLVIAGLLLEHDNLLTCQLRTGAVVSYSGSYFDEDGDWGFVASAGEIFSIFVPQDRVIAFTVGGASDRIDTLEVRPTRVPYNIAERAFKDPVTGQVTSSEVETRYKYDFEFQILPGTEGAGVAPTHTTGWVKIAEVTVPASASFLIQSNIKDVRDSNTWTTEAEATKYKAIVYAATVPIDDAGGRYTAEDIEKALQEIAGAGRTNETVKGNADDLASHNHDLVYVGKTGAQSMTGPLFFGAVSPGTSARMNIWGSRAPGNDIFTMYFYNDQSTDGGHEVAQIAVNQQDANGGQLRFRVKEGGAWNLALVIDKDGKVGIGTPTPTSELQVVGLPIYASNAAAVTGGLTAGAFYRTGVDPDPVCVVH